MKKITTILALTFGYLLVVPQNGIGQYTVLHDFNDTLGGNVQEGTVTAIGRSLFGMTFAGGAHDSGCVFSMDTTGARYKVIFSFGGTTGGSPSGSLISSGSTLYGMTNYGGRNIGGVVFSIDTDGTGYKDLYDFGSFMYDAQDPYGTLVLSGNTLFGMTQSGGSPFHYGTIFSIHTDGSNYKILVQFEGQYNPQGKAPLGSLIVSDNKLFGMTQLGGSAGYGVVFSCDTDGSNYKLLLTFNSTNGSFPWGDVLISGKTLFGMAQWGGAKDSGCVFSIDTNGSGYRDLMDFTNASGNHPLGSLTMVGNKFYGLTQRGGLNGEGVFFSIDTDGTGYTKLVDFNGVNYPRGGGPNGSVIYKGGNFYGMAGVGRYNWGLVFSFKDTSIITSINQLAQGSGKVFPNPSSGTFTLSLSNISEKCNVEIFNVLGEKIEQAKINSTNTEINLSGQPQGIYLYRVLKDDGSLMGSGKIMIRK